MNHYKITNVTNSLGKRDMHFNTTLNVEYVDKFEKKIIKIEPNETIILTIDTLPLSLQRLKLRNLITIIPINSNELKKEHDVKKKKVVDIPKQSKIKKSVETKKLNNKTEAKSSTSRKSSTSTKNSDE